MIDTLPQISDVVLQAEAIPPDSGLALGLGIAVGLAAYGAGLAERGIGAAAVGALAEDSLSLAVALVMTVIPETLVLLALVVAFIV